MSERSDNPPLSCRSPHESASFSMSEWSDNPPLSRHSPPELASFSMPGRSDNPPLDHHGPPKPTLFSVPGRLDNLPPLGRHGPPMSSASFSVPGCSEIRFLSALKIIHAGGIAEYYYKATPAARILDKYPSFILARPDSTDEILIPGQKYYVVPQRTLKKLRRRIKKNSGIIINTNNFSFISQSSQDSSKSKHSSIIKTKPSSDKNKARNHRVRFFGIDCKQDSCSVSLESKENREEDHGKSLNNPQRIRAGNVLTWQPTLTVKNEK
ncbi:hypothetical protein RND71_037286 [Anisodus tanguticus]|uniref:Uncharacterized protein n=1 Tax=Anisodus tanguticus TaxID=243964 RepID=A0AAE1R5L7_9SOLA|nr:hypothetical protein RND71_037286 [Anisodus tanguticus]